MIKSRLPFALCLIVAVTMPAVVAAADTCSDGARLRLLDFLSLDSNGGRLKSWDGASYVHQWVDEPGWDEVTLIDGYQISQCACSGFRCSLTVDYQLSRTSGQPQVFAHENGGIESMAYDVIKIKGKGWRIKGIEAPRIYRHRYLISTDGTPETEK